MEPGVFWREFSTKVTQLGRPEDYQRPSVWTSVIDRAFDASAHALGFEGKSVAKEFYRVDHTLWQLDDREEEWDLVLAFEHENGPTWTEELMKLAHLSCPLRVLISYHDYSLEPNILVQVQRAVELLKRRPHRARSGTWLLAFGPVAQEDREFSCYVINGSDLTYELLMAGAINPVKLGSHQRSRVQVGRPGTKYVRFPIDVWYQVSDRSIHMTSQADDRFHTTVKNDPNSKRYHRSLYDHLRRALKEAGRWPGESRQAE